MLDTARTDYSQYTSSVVTIDTSRSSEFSHLTPRSGVPEGFIRSVSQKARQSSKAQHRNKITTTITLMKGRPLLNPYGFNYHSVKSLHDIKANGLQPLQKTTSMISLRYQNRARYK